MASNVAAQPGAGAACEVARVKEPTLIWSVSVNSMPCVACSRVRTRSVRPRSIEVAGFARDG